jgi:hypothetical protein
MHPTHHYVSVWIFLRCTVCSRMVSCVDKTLLVSPFIDERYRPWGYPSQFNFRSKCLTLWQKILGVDVFIYGVYVQVRRPMFTALFLHVQTLLVTACVCVACVCMRALA